VAKRFIYHEGPDAFAPIFYPDRLSQPGKVKKPSKIFVCSMADLFGDWVPDEWIVEVLDTVRGYAWHTYQFLTKNPQRLKDFNPWPRNAWVGTTVTNQADGDERIPWLLQVDARVRFVSHEPLLSEIYVEPFLYLTGASTAGPWHDCLGKRRHFPGSGVGGQMISSKPSGDISWAIIGAMTGPGAVKVDPEWVQNLMGQYQAAGVPVFLKDNLKGLVGVGLKDWVQEWPK